MGDDGIKGDEEEDTTRAEPISSQNSFQSESLDIFSFNYITLPGKLIKIANFSAWEKNVFFFSHLYEAGDGDMIEIMGTRGKE